MAYFLLARFLVFFHVFHLAHHAMSAPVIESYKPSARRVRATTGVKKWGEFNKLVKRLEHKIDQAEVRQKIMEAQMKFPLAYMGRGNKMHAAFKNFYYTIRPSNIYYNTTITTRDGRHLQIFEDGTVNGTTDHQSPYAQLAVESVGPSGLFRIKGMLGQKYLIYKKNGRVAAETQNGSQGKRSIKNSIFVQKLEKSKDKERSYNMGILNLEYQWYLGFRHNDVNRFVLKKGPRVKFPHRDSNLYINLGPRIGR